MIAMLLEALTRPTVGGIEVVALVVGVWALIALDDRDCKRED